MKAFSLTTGPLIELMEANKRETRTLAATRDLLLPKLMSGVIRVKVAEKVVEAAL
jgi:type I restriction enzyme S subunit